MEESIQSAVDLAKKTLAHKQAQRDLIRYCEVMTPDPNDRDDIEKSSYSAQKFHKVLAKILEKIEAGELKRVLVTFPPRHGKTELASKKFPSWLIGRNPRDSVIFVTYNQIVANDNGKAVRTLMQNPKYKEIFKEAELKKGNASSDRLETQQGGVLIFTGRDGTITSRGGDLIVIDDIFKNRKDADSATTRDSVWNWFRGTISNRFMSDKGAMIIITTRWHEDDLVGRLTNPNNPHYNKQEADQWKIVTFTGLAEEGDILGRKVGEALWPERFGRKYLLNYKNLSSRDFASLYQQRPSPEEGNLFKKEHFKTYNRNEIPEDLRIYAASDLAVSTKQENDRTCLMIVGIDKKDTIWILEVVWKKIKSDKAVEEMVRLMKKWKPVTWWGEKGQLSNAIKPFLRKRMREEKVYCNINELSASGDKVSKAQSFFGRMSMGMVLFPKFATWYNDAKSEMLSFPSGTHDDFVDTCSQIGLGLLKMVKASTSKDEKQEYKVGTLNWIKKDSRFRQKQRSRLNRLRGY